jgi:hypothetical protein
MSWVVIDGDRFKHAIRGLSKQRDRGAGIIAASIVQEHLIEAIKSRLRRDADLEGRMFGLDGALGSFAAQIDLGYLMGLYPKGMQTWLRIIKTIRNDFAHSAQPVNFKSHRTLCSQFKTTQRSTRKINKTISSIFGREPSGKLLITSYYNSSNPRTQYIRAAQQITAFLTLQIHATQIETPWIKLPGAAAQPAKIAAFLEK